MATSDPPIARRRPHGKAIRRWSFPSTVSARRHRFFWPGIYLAILSLASGVLALIGQSRPRYEEGQIIPRTIVARAQFISVDGDKSAANRIDAHAREPNVYRLRREEYVRKVRERFNALYQLGAGSEYPSMDKIPPADRIAFDLDQGGWALQELRSLHSPEVKAARTWDTLVDDFIAWLTEKAILSDDQAEKEKDAAQRASHVRLLNTQAKKELDVYDNAILAVTANQPQLVNAIKDYAERPGFPPALRQCFVAIVLMQPEPLYAFDADETETRKNAAFANEPPVQRTYAVNDVVVRGGTALRATDLTALADEHHAYVAQLSFFQRWLKTISMVGLTALIGLGLWVYVWAYNRRIALNPTRGLALTGLLIVGQTLAVGFGGIAPQYAVIFATFPVLLVSIIFAIAYDNRFAMACGAVLVILVTLSLELPLGLGLMMFAGLAVAAAQLGEVRSRTKLLWVGVWTGLAMSVVALITGLVDRPLNLNGQFKSVLIDSLLAVVTGVVTGLFVQGILPAIEGIFKVTTALSLKDLSDASLPLLRRLAQDAPGTYQHSLRLADLVESAAASIGANSLLCKVGALYHDVGKINKPLYFIENQADGLNRHRDLPPAMSLLIIVGHVKDGMEMAREYKVPPVLRHFIESHHGTTLVEFFYHAAKKQSEQQHAPPPAEFEFRYSGPKPQTREAAILMIGDSLESAARAMDNPTPARIEQLVHAIANARLADGQFNECSLTLQELHKIEQSMIRTLSAMHHNRIKYPAAERPAAGTISAS